MDCSERVETRFSVPWETRVHTGQGLFSAWWETCRDISFKFSKSLQGVGKGAMAPALAFGVLTYSVGMVFYLPFSMGMQMLDPTLGDEEKTILLIVMAVMLVFLPLWSLVAFFLGAAMYHPFFKLVGGKGDFTATLRATCYGLAPVIFYVVPCFGWLLGGALTMITSVYSQKYAHDISGFRVVGAWFIMFAVMMVFFGVVIGLIAVAAGLAG